jgi:sugar phosphate isomerase/epimerase
MAAEESLAVVQLCENLPADEGTIALAREKGVAIEIGTRGIDSLESALGIAQLAHSPIVRLVIDTQDDEPSVSEATERLLVYREQFEEAGVVLAIENHDRFRSSMLAGLVESLGSHWAGICLDTANSLGSLEGPEETTRMLAPYSVCVHIKDVVARRESDMLGFRIYGVPAGTGSVDIGFVLQEVRSYRDSFSVILEQWLPLAEDEVAGMNAGLRTLRTCL